MRSVLFIPAMFVITMGKSQSVSKAQWDDLSLRMYRYVFDQLPEVHVTKQSEMVFVFFETDSSARISSIHIKGDPKDSIYNILMRMPFSLFNGWSCDACINKIIIVPYFYWFFESKNNYAYRVYKDYYSKRSYEEYGNTIRARPMVSFAPVVMETSCHGTPFTYITDSISKEKSIIDTTRRINAPGYR